MISDCGLYDNLSYHKSSVVSAGFTRNVSAVILILGESCLELLMECTEVYFNTISSQNVFHRFFARILMIHLFLERISQP